MLVKAGQLALVAPRTNEYWRSRLTAARSRTGTVTYVSETRMPPAPGALAHATVRICVGAGTVALFVATRWNSRRPNARELSANA